jgi:saccharopine dehydrogenase-like NADP-dependent oxidoreductase
MSFSRLLFDDAPPIMGASFSDGAVMKRIAVVGAGKIGHMIADMLGKSGDYQLAVIDKSAEQLDRLRAVTPVECLALDVNDPNAVAAALRGRYAVLSAAPFQVTGQIAAAAAQAGVHYLDLTEDVANTRRVRELASGARTAFIPQCGLAPGFITIVGYDLAKRFDELHDVRLRVGALPQYPSNALNYNLTWSTDGVINEYCEPCEEIANGELVFAPALEEREEFSLDGVTYEAFNTSGGVGSLCETLRGRVRNLNYRTIRYPGHVAIMKMLLQDLKLRDRRELLKDILEHALPTTVQDVVIVFVTVTGRKKGQLVQETYANKIYGQRVNGVDRSAIQLTTAAGICAVLDLLAERRLPSQGFIRQEDIPLQDFLGNRFGRLYAPTQRQAVEACAA